eukprot:CAMPEP_0175862490 /NCGR_PEP_ID=MMETSP0107_2-20121207/31974_1 /TAXON_ID=195067 ORGANISM="Goniomonas pacifica, Strain CCMP1869" /NCGR_SAMPLE_ID=MMETSP0107_2 /ASSEMBLY_ACC=CAM_ASM_000203 /LENGTH=55 /DNA_ID=CAMNT_0017179495 /DNA_START=1 /DNA_END=165 /DNA_ORIENTATION=+
MLVGAGANVNATNDRGNTPLDLANQECHNDVVALLQASEPLTKSAAQGGAGGDAA